MGTLHYGDAQLPVIELPDRVLAHVKRIMIDRLRRSESMMFSWSAEGSGDSTVWIHPAIPLHFQFDGPEPLDLNRQWLDAMAKAAASYRGLTVIDEPAPADVTPAA